jgi:hypothetical protein
MATPLRDHALTTAHDSGDAAGRREPPVHHPDGGQTMFKRSLLFAGVALLATSVAAHAQTATAGVSVDVGSILVISTSGSFGFPAADDSHYQGGYIESTSGPTLEHRANVPYKITLAAQSGSTLSFANATGRTDTDPNKPIGDLSVLSTIGGTPVNVAVGAAGSAADFYNRAARGSTQSSALSARLALDYANDPPGTYSSTIVFTMVAQ